MCPYLCSSESGELSREDARLAGSDRTAYARTLAEYSGPVSPSHSHGTDVDNFMVALTWQVSRTTLCTYNQRSVTLNLYVVYVALYRVCDVIT